MSSVVLGGGVEEMNFGHHGSALNRHHVSIGERRKLQNLPASRWSSVMRRGPSP